MAVTANPCNVARSYVLDKVTDRLLHELARQDVCSLAAVLRRLVRAEARVRQLDTGDPVPSRAEAAAAAGEERYNRIKTAAEGLTPT